MFFILLLRKPQKHNWEKDEICYSILFALIQALARVFHSSVTATTMLRELFTSVKSATKHHVWFYYCIVIESCSTCQAPMHQARSLLTVKDYLGRQFRWFSPSKSSFGNNCVARVIRSARTSLTTASKIRDLYFEENIKLYGAGNTSWYITFSVYHSAPCNQFVNDILRDCVMYSLVVITHH